MPRGVRRGQCANLLKKSVNLNGITTEEKFGTHDKIIESCPIQVRRRTRNKRGNIVKPNTDDERKVKRKRNRNTLLVGRPRIRKTQVEEPQKICNKPVSEPSKDEAFVPRKQVRVKRSKINTNEPKLKVSDSSVIDSIIESVIEESYIMEFGAEMQQNVKLPKFETLKTSILKSKLKNQDTEFLTEPVVTKSESILDIKMEPYSPDMCSQSSDVSQISYSESVSSTELTVMGSTSSEYSDSGSEVVKDTNCLVMYNVVREKDMLETNESESLQWPLTQWDEQNSSNITEKEEHVDPCKNESGLHDQVQHELEMQFKQYGYMTLDERNASMLLHEEKFAGLILDLMKNLEEEVIDVEKASNVISKLKHVELCSEVLQRNPVAVSLFKELKQYPDSDKIRTEALEFWKKMKDASNMGDETDESFEALMVPQGDNWMQIFGDVNMNVDRTGNESQSGNEQRSIYVDGH